VSHANPRTQRQGSLGFRNFSDTPVEKLFENYDYQRLLNTHQKSFVPEPEYSNLKEIAIHQLEGLREKEQLIDERERKQREALLKLVKRKVNAPLVLAWKKWNWQKYQIKKLLTNERERIRIKYIQGTKNRQVNISNLKERIQKSHRVEKETYDQ
jgi:hypothetical protein